MHVNIGQRVLVNLWGDLPTVATVVGVSRGETPPMVMVETRRGRTILRGSDALYGVEPI